MTGINYKSVWILLFTFYFLIACNSDQKPIMGHELAGITLLHCKASRLKDARFSLADSIRFLQDSILKYKEKTNKNVSSWKLELEKMEDKKITLANQSRNLGDSIRQVIFQLTHEMTLEEKRIFNDSLKAQTEKSDCF